LPQRGRRGPPLGEVAPAVVLLLASRTIRNKHLACLVVVILLALVLVARRRILFE